MEGNDLPECPRPLWPGERYVNGEIMYSSAWLNDELSECNFAPEEIEGQLKLVKEDEMTDVSRECDGPGCTSTQGGLCDKHFREVNGVSRIVAYAIFAGGNEVKRIPVDLGKPYEITGITAMAIAAHLAVTRWENDVHVHIVTQKES
jgi:hypothetical protein